MNTEQSYENVAPGASAPQPPATTGLSQPQARLLSNQIFEAHQQHHAVSKLVTPQQKEALDDTFRQTIARLFTQHGLQARPDTINLAVVEELCQEVVERNILLAVIKVMNNLPASSTDQKARILDEFLVTINNLTSTLPPSEHQPLANSSPAPELSQPPVEPIDDDSSLISLPFWFKDSWARDYPSLVETKTLLSEIFSHYFGSQAFTDQEDPEAMVTLSKRLQELLDEVGMAIIQGTVANAEDHLFAVSDIHSEDLTYTLLDTLLTKDQITEVFTSFYTSEEYEALSLPGQHRVDGLQRTLQAIIDGLALTAFPTWQAA